jgi:ADP-ribose pyrophosphatase YjhB (NUDIX family)
MPISPYLRMLRERVGDALLLVPSVTVVARDEHGRVLLVRHADANQWVAPGGSIEPGERPEDAALREMREETGLEVELRGLLGVYGGPEFEVRYRNGDRVAYVMVVYDARVVGGRPRPDGLETLELRWVDVDELASLDLPRWARRVLPDVFATTRL